MASRNLRENFRRLVFLKNFMPALHVVCWHVSPRGGKEYDRLELSKCSEQNIKWILGGSQVGRLDPFIPPLLFHSAGLSGCLFVCFYHDLT